MATEAQIAANRQNAQSSTGARTEAGKAASSGNALTLGLYTRASHVRPEERDLYEQFCETLYAELSPEGLLEQSFVSDIKGATWRLRGCDAAEAGLADFDETTDKTRRSIERARANAHSILNRSVNQLRRLQTERTCRLLLNAAGGDEGIADYKEVTVAVNNYEKGKHLHAKSREMNLAAPLEPDWSGLRFGSLIPTETRPKTNTSGRLGSICEMPRHEGDAAEAALASICKTPEPIEIKGHSTKAESAEPPRNSPCPCNSALAAELARPYPHESDAKSEANGQNCCARQGPGWPSLVKAA